MENILVLILGLFISVIGIINMLGNISTIHSYNRTKVKEEDIPSYGRVVGIGTLTIGVGLIISFFLSLWKEEYIEYAMIPAVVVGILFILYGQIRYNKGLF